MKYLNSNANKTWGKSKGWHQSYVQKIIHNRAVLGEYQPHKLVDGKRVPVGEPVEGYYPQIIKEEDFLKVQMDRKARRNKGGRQGKYFSNLFTNLVKCGYCGSSMQYVDKGKGPKGGSYLYCSNGFRNMGCYRSGWNYKCFEISAVKFINQIDIESIFIKAEEDLKIEELENRILLVESDLEKLKTREANIIESIAEGVPLPNLKEISIELSNEIKNCLDKLNRDRQKLDELKELTKNRVSNIENIKELIGLDAGSITPKEQGQNRLKVNQYLKSLIEKIELYFLGNVVKEDRMEKIKEIVGDSDYGKKVLNHIRLNTEESIENRFFVVYFKNKKVQYIIPSFDDPSDCKFDNTMRLPTLN